MLSGSRDGTHLSVQVLQLREKLVNPDAAWGEVADVAPQGKARSTDLLEVAKVVMGAIIALPPSTADRSENPAYYLAN